MKGFCLFFLNGGASFQAKVLYGFLLLHYIYISEQADNCPIRNYHINWNIRQIYDISQNKCHGTAYVAAQQHEKGSNAGVVRVSRLGHGTAYAATQQHKKGSNADGVRVSRLPRPLSHALMCKIRLD